MKNKLIIVALFLIFTNNSFSQSIYEKNGYWGVQYGANINIPNEKAFHTGTLFYNGFVGPIIPQKIYYVTLKPALGQYMSFSRSFKIWQMNQTNYMYIEPVINFSQVNYCFSYDELDDKNKVIDTEKAFVKNNAISINMNLKHLITPEQKNSFFYALNFELGYLYPTKMPHTFSWREKKYLKFIASSLELGYSFFIKDFLISPIVRYEIMNYRENINWGFDTGHPSSVYHKRYSSLKLGVMLNF
jgi:hypothetical protein